MLFNKKSLSYFIVLFTCSFLAKAQSTLPEIDILTKDGINIISWISPYKAGVKSIAVQRSADSITNFGTIGMVSNLKSTKQDYVDAHPLLGPNYYRVILTFNSDIEWISNISNIEMDSASIANQKIIPSNEAIQKIIEETGSTKVLENLSTISYPKSRYVFTNPFTGNINIEIPDATQNTYTLVFYDDNEKKVLEILSILEEVIILDKRNFQSLGIFKFKLFKNKQEFEKGVITIY